MISKREDLAEKIYALSTLQQNFVIERLKSLHLNSLQSRSLNFIAMYPGTMQRELANYLGKQQATVTNILKVLEEKKLIYRRIPKNNERQKNIYLTPEGEQMVEKVQTIFDELGRQMESVFSKEERQQFELFLKRAEDQLA
ncbi:MarR family transcriptional regulator (plasmid) [Enterococcus gilvus]|uniref:MarR family winged helix-turn-helix transcriptional regulator n=1 Tax=Enterococcus gilvus TaxID=160453 RepID=UPI000DF62AB8|nr:MarR family winged helix-turn-helix transcriptional regulator [Enterococcus gilvus]AXG39914.1 MarR family transcriptional regulator [Enterococcus gilvus]